LADHKPTAQTRRRFGSVGSALIHDSLRMSFEWFGLMCPLGATAIPAVCGTSKPGVSQRHTSRAAATRGMKTSRPIIDPIVFPFEDVSVGKGTL
jgi:hypothetical protein